LSRAIVLVSAILVIVSAARCGSQRPRRTAGATQLVAGNTELSLTHDGRRRTFIVHVPQRLMARPPVLLAFHGGGGEAAGFQRYAQLDAVADREGFIVVYPNGTGPLPRRLLTWNSGDGCCGYAMQQRVDDVGFAIALIDDLARRATIDRRRIYVTGHSNGGILSHRLAAERPDVIAAAAPVAGSLDLARFAPATPVSVMQIHSVDDPRALYTGGLGPPFPGTNNRVLHQPVQAGLDRWVAANRCATKADTVEKLVGAANTPNAGQTATKIVWRSCAGGVEVAHWKLTVAGHGWPGDVPPPLARLVGPQTTLVRAADEVWAFVSRFSR
jgi:polyhydroxybutyrate depolymerase